MSQLDKLYDSFQQLFRESIQSSMVYLYYFTVVYFLDILK